ncbi:MAG: NADH-quinone oxidoreductase subunit NuoE [Elusimicrobia bacterium CG_4_10_14_0_2_um_filter_56_8]|nr:MAG: NADH-quinone oxidoreductase subunit NuoE [Elusimicrobia bacterium CG_4_10_14_0_2_um_filter_56_8]
MDNTVIIRKVDSIVAKYGHKKGSLIALLQLIQGEFGYLPRQAIERLSQKIDIAPAEIIAVYSFYAQFRATPVGRQHIKVCHGTACHVSGADKVSYALNEELGINHGQTTKDGEFSIENVACLGCCSLAPVVMIQDETYGAINSDKIKRIVKDRRAAAAGPRGQNQSAAASGTKPAALKPAPGITLLRLGMGSCGIAAGARKTLAAINSLAAEKGLELEIMSTGCNGMCHEEPLLEVVQSGKSFFYGKVNPEAAERIIEEHVLGGKPAAQNLIISPDKPMARHPFYAKQQRIVLRNCGVIDPDSIGAYESAGGYSALRKALKEIKPEKIIAEISASGLRGRGGAGFPTGTKWKFASAVPGPEKYVVCNGDEGDPGAFMDRSVLESDPHAVLEGLMLAAYAVGATKGIFYVRAEYPLAVKRINSAIAAAEKKGLLGENILGSGFSFTAYLKEGAGAFVCGEETALIASVEGKRGMPRIRPPYPVQSGIFGHSTTINNVETLACVPWIIQNGAAAFNKFGTEKSKGTKVFALAGKITRGGLVEVPMGLTLREVVNEVGGGVPGGRKLKAVQMGGPSGGCIPENLMDTPIDYDSLNATGAIMGSGGMVVMDDSTCMVDVARFFLKFTQNESCGKCTFCRVGTKRMLEILERICAGKGVPADMETLRELGESIKKSSLCGLGQTAPNPVLTTMRYFEEEYKAHILGHTCPAGVCKALISYRINSNCSGCTLCARRCPVSAITGSPKKLHSIDEGKCTRCGICKDVCRFKAVDIVSREPVGEGRAA